MSRRKPALRIGGGVLNRNTLYQKDVPENNGLGLLGAYGDDDEDEQDSKPSIVQNDLTQAINNLDSKVADFLKEIDELEANDTKSQDGKATDPPQISYGSWQQCIDERTQHPYYWNTETNEVTWVLPEEISKQLEAMSEKSQTQSEPTKSATVQDSTTNNKFEGLEKNEKASIDRNIEVRNDIKADVEEDDQCEDSFGIDVDAELDQALESGSDPITQPSQLDLELEILRRRLLPLSDQEEQDVMTRFESEILKLEEDAEEKRANGQWKKYDKMIIERKNEINLNKTTWRTERLPELMKMGVAPETQEKQDEMFTDDENIEKNEEDDDLDSEIKEEPKPEDPKTSETTHADPEDKMITESSTQNNDTTDDTNKTEEDISTLSGTIFDKLNFLGISQKAFTNFHRLLIELETRITDWKDGMLPGSYLLKKLQIATQQLKTYEETATPNGWSCQWDRSAKRYFYRNNKTKETQWQYPESVNKSETAESLDTSSKNEGSNKNKRNALTPTAEIDVQPKKSKTEETAPSSDKISTSSIPSSLQHSGQYLYPGYGQTYGSYHSPYSIEGATPPPPPGEESFAIPPPLPSTPAEKPPLPPPPPDDEIEGGEIDDDENDDGIMMEMSDDEDTTKKSEPETTATMSQQPVLYKPQTQTHFQATMTGYPMYMTQTADVTYRPQSTSPVPQAEGTSTQSVTRAANLKKTTAANAKTKKVKKVKKSAVVKKPAKGISSLVAQWQKAKHQIEEEDRMLEEDEEEEIDHQKLSKQQIEKWKQEQILSGKAWNNANFEPVPDDWRSRILKKKGKI